MQQERNWTKNLTALPVQILKSLGTHILALQKIGKKSKEKNKKRKLDNQTKNRKHF